MTQPLLNFSHPRVAIKAAEYMDRFLSALTDGQWHKSSELQTTLRTSERVLRKCADASKGRVISGQQGYKLTRFATVEEVDHAEAWLLSQARQMTDRAREIRVARNGRAA